MTTNPEHCLLACILIDSKDDAICQAIQAKVTPEHFTDIRTRTIWTACNEVYDSGGQPELTVVFLHLQKTGKLKDAGDLAFLSKVSESAHTSHHAPLWIKEVCEAYRKRRIDSITRQIHAANSEPESQGKLHQLVESLNEIAGNAVEGDLDGDWGDTIDRTLKRVSDVISGVSSRFEVSTCFPGMDFKAGKPNLGDYIILAGPSGGGKSALACNLAYHIAKSGWRTAFFSLEMMDEQLVLRMATALTKISLNQLRSAHKLEREQFQDQLNELKRLETLKVYQRKSDARTIEATIRHLVKKWGLQVVFIDYVQLMEPFDTKDNREQQVARMSRMLKRLTREYRILIFALAQINKDHEKEKRKPRASDLRESQSLRQDADGCYFVYKPAENFQGFEQQPDATTYDMMYYNDKNRNNATGQTVWLRFFADIQLMKEIDMSQK